MAYSKDADLVKVRPDILSLGQSTWREQISQADAMINRYLDTNWYRQNARDHRINWRNPNHAFDPFKLTDATQVKMASVYLSLSLAYGFLAKNNQEDGFHPQRDYYRTAYETEIKSVVLYGIDYDWPDQENVATPKVARRLIRG